MAIHEEYVELISAAVDGTLSEAEAARLAAVGKIRLRKMNGGRV